MPGAMSLRDIGEEKERKFGRLEWQLFGRKKLKKAY